jgi:endo-1,4-beta-xylanase
MMAANLPRVSLYADASVATEGFGDALRYSVVRDAVSSTPLTVLLQYGGLPDVQQQFISPPTSVTIPAGSRTVVVVLSPRDDALSESAKPFNVSLASDPAYRLGSLSTRKAQGTLFDDDRLTGGQPVINDAALGAFYHFGSDVSVVPASGQGFSQARRVAVTQLPATIYEAGLRARNDVAVQTGDRMLVSFWVRNLDATPVDFAAVIEEEGNAYTRSVTFGVRSRSTQWQRVFFRAESAGNYAPGQLVVGLQVGTQLQRFEVAGFSWTNYGRSIAVSDLPHSTTNWSGRSGTETAWRDEAESRIDQTRKADLNVVVRDASGRLVPNSSVRVKLTQHAFGFGSAVDAYSLLYGEPSDRAIYQQIVRDNFSKVVLENDLKWPEWQWNAQQAVDAIDWLNGVGIDKIRGHNLIWPYWGWMPASPGDTYGGINYRSDPDKADALEEYEAHVAVDGPTAALAWIKARIIGHIQEQASDPRIRGRLEDWDVINEPIYANELLSLVGEAEMNRWLAAARAADPSARLFVNDYPALDGGAQLDAFYDLLTRMIASNAEVDGLGLQGHLGATTPDIDRVLATFERFDSLGLPMQITEFDIVHADEQVQADYLRDMMLAAFSTPSIDTFLIWGFWQDRHWQPDAALWRSDWSIKPNGQTFIDLLNSEWTTDQRLSTDSSGSVTLRGYKGSYDVEVNVNGDRVMAQVTLASDGQTLNIVVPDRTAPKVMSTPFLPGGDLPRLVINFDELIGQNVSTAGVSLRHLSTGRVVSATQLSFAVEGSALKIDLPRSTDVLIDGIWRLELPAGTIRDAVGNATAPGSADFRVLAADADQNGAVGFNDLIALGRSYGQTGQVFSTGNFDYSADGLVGFNDLLLLAQRYQSSLPWMFDALGAATWALKSADTEARSRRGMTRDLAL